MFKPRAPNRFAPVVESLEARILYSADSAPLAIGQELANAWVQAVEPVMGPVQTSSVQTSSGQVSSGQVSSGQVGSMDAVTELVIIDSRVDDQQSLINDLSAQRDAGRSVSWLLIEADQDGLSVISAALQNAGRLDSLHLVAHGEPGELQLGSSTLNIDSVRLRAGELSQWASHFGENADLLVYGCELAAGESGRQLVDALSVITGADIAASVDLTGSGLLGGNWVLEQATGVIESRIAFTEAEQDLWRNLLNAIPNANESLINNGTTGNQTFPDGRGTSQVAALPGGNAFVVWRNYQDNEIYGRFLDSAGVPTGSDILISANAGDTSDPAVAFDATTSKIVVVWAEIGSDGDNQGIFSRTITLAGVGSAVTQINSATAGNQYQPAVAVRNGFALITWTDDQAYSRETVFYRTQAINSLFLFPGSVFSETSGSHNRNNSTVAYSDTSDFIIVWESDGNEDGSGKGIYARAMNPFGFQYGPEFQVNTSTTGDQHQPTVIGTRDGGYVVAWTNSNGGDEVIAQRLGKTGALVGSEFLLNSYLPDSQNNVSLAATDVSGSNVGGFVATWQSKSQAPDSADYGIFVRQFYGDGRALGAEQLINQTVNGRQDAPSVMVNGSGGMVVWSGSGTGDPNDIHSGTFDLIEPQLSVSALAGLTETSEAGGTVVLRYRLTTAPTANVVVTLSSNDTGEGVPLTTTLTFTPANWNVVQNVTIGGVDDAIVDGQIPFNIRASMASADVQYGVLPAVDIGLSNIDDDNQNFIVVSTAADIADGNVTSIANLVNDRGADGKISFREAISAANNTANGAGGLDTIRFDPALGSFTISLNSALPSIETPMHIDGISFTVYSTHPVITLTRGGGGVYDGLVLAAGSDGSKIEGLAIGGFDGTGIAILANNNTIRYNHIGVNDVGSAALSNTGNGILLTSADDNSINNNVISGNAAGGIYVSWSDRTSISANTIGANAGRTAMIANLNDGVMLIDSKQSVVSGNLIGGNNRYGVRITGSGSSDNTIASNFIGTDASGTLSFRNLLDGVAIDSGASNNLVGGLGAGSGNRIYNNTERGIHVWGALGTTTGNALLGNLLDNNGHGIQLGSAGVEALAPLPNDPGDVDTGANNRQNKPVLYSAVPEAGSMLRVIGALESQASTTYTIQLFADSTPSGNGFGEAQVLIDSFQVSTDPLGTVAFNRSMAYLLSGFQTITATATRYDNILFRNSDTSEFARSIPVNSVPVWTTAAGVGMSENTTPVAVLAATDPDAPITYSINGGADAARFSIIGNQLNFIAPPDYETPGSTLGTNNYDLVLRATDGLGGFADLTFSVTVMNALEAPYLSAPFIGTPSTAENSLLNLTLNVIDPEGSPTPTTYTIFGGADQALFEIQAVTNKLVFRNAPDFETALDANGDNVYEVVVRLTDTGGNTGVPIFVTVTNLPEAPVWVTPPGVSTPENLLFAQSLSATDPDNSPAITNYSIVGGADAARFAIASGELTWVAQPDFEQPTDFGANNVYQVIVRATDGGGDIADRTFSVTVTDSNKAPVFDQTGSIFVSENRTLIQVLSATDPESSAASLNFSIVGGADASKFNLNNATRELSFVVAPNFEAPTDTDADGIYQVLVAVADPNGNATIAAFQVRVDDLFEAVSVVGPTSVQAIEDTVFAFSDLKKNLVQLEVLGAINAQLSIRLSVDHGSLSSSLAGTAVYDKGTGTHDKLVIISGGLADVNLTLESLLFTPESNYAGAAILSIAASETSSFGAGTTASIGIDIAPVNDEPRLDQVLGINVSLGTPTVLSQTSLHLTDIDDADADLIYTVFALPADVQIRLNGQVVTVGGSFTQADVNAGLLSVSGNGSGNRTDQMVLKAADRSGASALDATIPLNLVFGNSTGTGSGTGGGGGGSGGGSGGRSGGSGSSGSGSGAGDSTSSTTTTTTAAASAAAASKDSDATASVARAFAPPVATTPSNQATQNKSGTAISPTSSSDSRSAAPSIFRDLRNLADLHGSDQSRLARFESNPRMRLMMDALAQAGSTQSPLRAEQSASFSAVQRALIQKATAADLDRFREQLKSKIAIEHSFAASSAAVSASVSIGYVIWLLRGGVLLSSLLASIPAWSAIDPLPIFSNAGAGKRGKDGDDESLQDMLKKAELERERLADQPLPATQAAQPA